MVDHVLVDVGFIADRRRATWFGICRPRSATRAIPHTVVRTCTDAGIGGTRLVYDLLLDLVVSKVCLCKGAYPRAKYECGSECKKRACRRHCLTIAQIRLRSVVAIN